MMCSLLYEYRTVDRPIHSPKWFATERRKYRAKCNLFGVKEVRDRVLAEIIPLFDAKGSRAGFCVAAASSRGVGAY